MNVELETFITQLRKAGIPYTRALQDFRRQFLVTLLSRHNGNQCAVARELGVHRNTIKREIDELGIDPLQIRAHVRRSTQQNVYPIGKLD